MLLAGDGVQRLIDPPTYDMAKIDSLIDRLRSPRGASDLPAALAEAFRILERTENPGRDVIILTDGQRYPWRPARRAVGRCCGAAQTVARATQNLVDRLSSGALE